MRYSHSQIQVYASCPLKYRYRYLDSLVQRGSGGQHDLDYGHAMHAAIAAYYQGGTVGEMVVAFTADYPPNDYPAVLPLWSQGKTYDGGVAALTAYPEWAEGEDQWWEVVSVEERGTADDDTRTVKLDLVVRDTRDGLIYGVDTKVTGKYITGSSGRDFWLTFEPHSQIRQYVGHLQEKFGEVGGFYVNAIALKHRSKAYTPRQGPDKGVRLEAGDWYDFGRQLYTPNGSAIVAERESFRRWVTRIEADKAAGMWGYNTDQCVKGSMLCEYYRICSRGLTWPADADMVSSDYRQQCQRTVGGKRCQLEPEHDGEHDATRVVEADYAVETDDEVEMGEQ